MKINRLILCLLFVFNSYHSFASTQAVELRDQIARFIDSKGENLTAKGFRYEYEIGSIDPRLSVGQCNDNLSLQLMRPLMEQMHNTIKVSCTDHTPWKLFVSASITIYGQVITAVSPITRGQEINLSNIGTKEAVINRSRQAVFSDPTAVTGMLAKRSIRAGQEITPGLLKAPNLISRGDQVVISAKNNAISIRMNGTALSHGALGQQIRVKNNKSERIIKAKVVDQGLVSITM